MVFNDISMAKAELSAGSMSYAIRPGGDACILFLHGLACSKTSFMEALTGNYFDRAFTLLAPDLFGHGDSARDAGFSYELVAQADLLAELLDSLTIRKIVIVAHSMANICGLTLATKPFELIGFYCLEGNLIGADCHLSARIANFNEADFISKFFPMAGDRFRCGNRDSAPLADPVALYRSSRSLVNHCASDEPLIDFRRLTSRKAYFHGDNNAGLQVLSRLAGVELVSVPNAGHFMMGDNPDFTYGEISKRL